MKPMKLDAQYTQGEANLIANIGNPTPWMELLNFPHPGSAAIPRHFPASHPENRRAFFGHGLILETCSTPSSQDIPSVSDRYCSFLVVCTPTVSCIRTPSCWAPQKANSSSNVSVSKFIIYVGFKEVTVTVCMFVLVIHRYVSSPCIRVFMIIIIIILILNSSWRSFFGVKVSLGFLTIRFKARLPCGKGHPTKPSAQGIHTLGMCHTLVR